jgi:4-amino-4-deoxy-L-arabinose transferase-like glycosyltransferase
VSDIHRLSQPAPGDAVVERRLTQQDELLIAVVSLLILIPGMAGVSFVDRDEGWYAEVCRAMVVTGDWLVPRYLGEAWLAKPPLTYWLVSLSFSAFGMGEWQGRLSPLLATAVNAVLVGRLAASMFGRGVGRLAGLIFVTFGLSAIVGKMLLTDAVMLTCTLVAVDMHWRMATTGVTAKRALAYGVAIGLGILAKGPATLVFGGSFALALLTWDRTRGWIRHGLWWASIPVAAVVAAPWYLYISGQAQATLVEQFLWYEIFSRLAGTPHGHGGPPGYYLLLSTVGLLPWSLFIPGMLIESWKHGRVDRTVRVVFLWSAVPWVVLELIRSKLPHYIMPCYVPLAMLLARVTYLALVPQRRWEDVPRPEQRGLVAWTVVMMVIGAGVAIGMLVISRAAWAWAGAVAGLVLVGGFAWVLRRMKRRPLAHAWADAVIVTILFHFVAGFVVFPLMEPYRLSRNLAEQLKVMASAEDEIVLCGYREPSTFFYLDGRGEAVPPAELLDRIARAEKPMIVAVTEKTLNDMDDAARSRVQPILKEVVEGFDNVKMRNVTVHYGRLEPRVR